MRRNAKFSTSRLIVGGISFFGTDARSLGGDTRMHSPEDPAVLMTKPTPSDLRAEAQKLIRAGKMPSLSQVLDTIREVKGNPRYDAPVIQDALFRTEGKKQ
jgi:hypothetical protein